MKNQIFSIFLLLGSVAYSADMPQAGAARGVAQSRYEFFWQDADGDSNLSLILQPEFVRSSLVLRGSFNKLFFAEDAEDIVFVNSKEQLENCFLTPDYMNILQNIFFGTLTAEQKSCIDNLPIESAAEHFCNLISLTDYLNFIGSDDIYKNIRNLFRVGKDSDENYKAQFIKHLDWHKEKNNKNKTCGAFERAESMRAQRDSAMASEFKFYQAQGYSSIATPAMRYGNFKMAPDSREIEKYDFDVDEFDYDPSLPLKQLALETSSVIEKVKSIVCARGFVYGASGVIVGLAVGLILVKK